MQSPIAVIVNRRAGVKTGFGHPDGLDSIKQLFKKHNLDAEFLIPKHRTDIARLARKASNGNYRIVVAGGGDGTVNTVASEILGTDKVLGVLPMGTLNHFALDLGIPLLIDQAIAVIAEGEQANVDVGDVNGNIFINNSSIGLYPAMVRYRMNHQKIGYGKWSALAKAIPMVLRRYPMFSFRLKTKDHHDLSGRTPFVFIGNNEYQLEGTNFGRRNCLADGNLCLFVASEVSRFGLIRLAIQALFGRLREAKDFSTMVSSDILIETRRKRLRVAADGEIMWLQSPLHYRIRPSALKVIVPQKNVSPATIKADIETSCVK